MRIGYCTSTDSYDKKSWSGTHYFMMKALEKCGRVIPLGPLYSRFVIVGKIVNKLSEKITNRQFAYMHSSIIARDFAQILRRKIAKYEIDLLFFSGGSFILSYLNVNCPVIYLTDATFKSMMDYYPSFTNLLRISQKMGMRIEKLAIEKATKVICSSKWSAESVIRDYEADKKKVHVIFFGVNLDTVPSKEAVMEKRKKPRDILKLFLVGVNRIRKEGQIAFDTMV